jgi:hypothetical protein
MRIADGAPLTEPAALHVGDDVPRDPVHERFQLCVLGYPIQADGFDRPGEGFLDRVTGVVAVAERARGDDLQPTGKEVGEAV